MISVFMMIITVNQKPYMSNIENYGETLNEVVIIIVLYHVILASDFAPSYELDLKRINGYSMIGIITATVLGYIIYLIYDNLIVPILLKIK